MTGQFRPGQRVRLRPGLIVRSAASGEYKIVKRLPDTGSEPQYRIKSGSEPHERVVKGSELESV